MPLAVVLFANRSGGTPAISVDQQKIDYGYVKFSETRSIAVNVTNTGDGTLRFKEQPNIEVVDADRLNYHRFDDYLFRNGAR